MKLRRLEVFLEFLVFGVVVGVIEDAIAVKLVTGEPITLRVLGVILLVAIPFAFLGEIVVDKINFIKLLEKIFKKEEASERV
ncbi:hypothetical protein JW698_01245 [Candidatus Wolfebacteria bacterium]|nr:hypothetical protein [Candidatus Wolfebacteria bacterium]